jgi:2-methylcitrate dehydratase PrpD
VVKVPWWDTGVAEMHEALAVTPLTDILAGFVVETPGANLPAAAIDAAKDLILDTIGVALAAAPRPIGKTIIDYAAARRGAAGSATVWGGGIKVAPELAALANGTLANALDFDEGSHLPTHILPAALAVAEQQCLSGKDVLDAFIVGYEAGARLTQVIDARRREQRGPTHRGWWHVGLVGPVTAALTVCRLLKLNRRQAATAIGIASCGCGGFRRNMGTMAKALHSGNAARLGVEAAALAQSGFTADREIIEAPLGFLQAVCAREDRDEAAIIERLGRPYVLEAPLRMKRFPACNPGHPLIDAALRLRCQHVFSADEVELIEADLRTFSLLRPHPWDEISAGFSGAFLLAASLLHGAFGLDQLSDEAVHDPAIQALMARVRHIPAGQPQMLKVSLRGNRIVSAEILPVRRLTTGDAVREKFRDCAQRVLSPSSIEVVETQIQRLEEQRDVQILMAAAGASIESTDLSPAAARRLI